jgi:fructan beta-fructosidase
VDFKPGFASRSTAPRISKEEQINISLVIDVASVELFADDGLTVMTAVFFPGKDFSGINILSPDGITIRNFKYSILKPA